MKYVSEAVANIVVMVNAKGRKKKKMKLLQYFANSGL